MLEPLKGQIDPDASDFTVGKVKVEIRLAKKAAARWGGLVGDSPDRKCRHNALSANPLIMLCASSCCPDREYFRRGSLSLNICETQEELGWYHDSNPNIGQGEND